LQFLTGTHGSALAHRAFLPLTPRSANRKSTTNNSATACVKAAAIAQERHAGPPVGGDLAKIESDKYSEDTHLFTSPFTRFYAELAHVAERHRLAVGLLLFGHSASMREVRVGSKKDSPTAGYIARYIHETVAIGDDLQVRSRLPY
jgi:hypothetical protein